MLIPLTKNLWILKNYIYQDFPWKTPRDNYWPRFLIFLVWHYCLHIHIMELRFILIMFHQI